MTGTHNPYRPGTRTPDPCVDRPQLRERARTTLEAGRPVALLGGHGMGKSVLLTQIGRELESNPENHVLRIDTAPPDCSPVGCAAHLADKLGVEASLDLGDTLDRWLGAAENARSRLILLYDDLGKYLRDATPTSNFFDGLVDLSEAREGRIGLMVAGGRRRRVAGALRKAKGRAGSCSSACLLSCRPQGLFGRARA